MLCIFTLFGNNQNNKYNKIIAMPMSLTFESLLESTQHTPSHSFLPLSKPLFYLYILSIISILLLLIFCYILGKIRVAYYLFPTRNPF